MKQARNPHLLEHMKDGPLILIGEGYQNNYHAMSSSGLEENAVTATIRDYITVEMVSKGVYCEEEMHIWRTMKKKNIWQKSIWPNGSSWKEETKNHYVLPRNDNIKLNSNVFCGVP